MSTEVATLTSILAAVEHTIKRLASRHAVNDSDAKECFVAYVLDCFRAKSPLYNRRYDDSKTVKQRARLDDMQRELRRYAEVTFDGGYSHRSLASVLVSRYSVKQ